MGKTYILNKFGKEKFANYHHFDFSQKKTLFNAFEGNLDPDEIILNLEIQNNIEIDINKDLIIFDEIQDCPKALTSLKHFFEKYPDSFIISSGSFLGTTLSEEPYPVGTVRPMSLYPMTFFEFLRGMEQGKLLSAIINGTEKGLLSPAIHETAFKFFKYYLITGGLPQVVQEFKDGFTKLSKAFHKVRELQQELLDSYQNDIAKYSGKINAIKINSVFDSVPIQLARENKTSKKFVFKGVLPRHSKFNQLEEPIQWLIKAGLIYKVPICKKALAPLKAYTDHNLFNLYLFDIGILGVMVDLKPAEIFNYNYGSYKGYFAENFVIQELTPSLKQALYSWKEGQSEIEIVLNLNSGITPVEVKAGINTKAKSLKVFNEKYAPQRSFLISGEEMNIRKKGKSFLPLYCSSLLNQF